MRMPKCEDCRGACCEAFALRFDELRDLDARRWVDLHGTPDGVNTIFECRCSQLTSEGRCGIYRTRPNVCALFPVGGVECLRVIQRRRPMYWLLLQD